MKTKVYEFKNAKQANSFVMMCHDFIKKRIGDCKVEIVLNNSGTVEKWADIFYKDIIK